MNSIYWKLQSVNQSNELNPFSKEFELYRERFKKDFETRELMSTEETIEHYKKNAWKQPLFSKILSLTLAYVEEGVVRIKYITGNESDIIQTFLNTLKNDYFKDYQATHFGAEYILPYLGTRMDLNGFRTSTPKGLIYKGLRPWNLSGFCVRDYYTGAGNYKYNLKELAWIYNIETDFIDSIDEHTYYQLNKLEELKTSAIDEMFTLVNVHRLMIEESAVKDFQCSEEVVLEVKEVKPTNLLRLLHESQAMTNEVKEGLTLKLAKKKITKKDKLIIKELLLGVYINSDFINMNQDNKATIEKKTKEIDEFLNNL